jgi:ComF family protein
VSCRRLLRRLATDPVVLCGVPVWAPVAYSGPARDLVRALKFRGASALADTMAAQIVANAPAGLLGGRFVLVPVPLHPRRLRKRGYNQAALIAAALTDRTGLALADCLERSGSPVTQVGRDRRERRAGPAGSIQARAGPAGCAPPVPGRALLVDDVTTTGATLAACARALRFAGVPEVAAVTFARTIGR